MLYFDTSFLAPLVRQEATSTQIERFMQHLPAGDLAVSHWTAVEFSSLLALHIRMGGLTPDDARTINAAFDTMIDASFVVLLPGADDFKRAREYLAHHRTGLRAGDALHLAIAGNRQVDTIFSLDNTLISAGKVLGLPVSRGI